MTVEKLTEQRDGQNVIALRQDGKRRWAIASAGMGEKSTRFLYGEYADKLAEYESIGTPEECRAAREKQIPKRPKEYEDKYYGCPTCGNVLLHKWEKYPDKLMDKSNGLPYCLGCGQKLDWRNDNE